MHPLALGPRRSHSDEISIERIQIKTRRRNGSNQSLKVALVQDFFPADLIDKKAGEGIYTGPIPSVELSPFKQRKARRDVDITLGQISSNPEIIILSQHPGNSLSIDLLEERSNRTSQIIIARLGYHKRTNDSLFRNSIAIVIPNSGTFYHDQISLSVEDQSKNRIGELARGKTLEVFTAPNYKFSILNCHDYTNVELISLLLNEKLDFLVVPAFNPATRLFTEYALSDVHRLFGFVIISNIANYGGSGIFGPFRRKGKKQGISLSGILCHARGEGSAYLEYNLPLADLRKYRNYFCLPNGRLKAREPDSKLVSVLPPEYFLSERPEYYKWIDKSDFIKNVNLLEMGYVPELDRGNATVAIAHLKSIDQEAYMKNYYNFSASELMPEFANKLNLELDQFFEKVSKLGIRPNFIVFPEVFLPLGLEEKISKKALELNSIIIGGFEYDPQIHLPLSPEEAIGANRCFIYVPSIIENRTIKFEYRKLTFSKYDAMIGENQWFKLQKGSNLLRFHHKDLGSFGALICYDYSHFDIVYSINRHENVYSPLDILFIVSQNPDASLYRHCCISDSHRFYQYIIMCNISQYGGSGIFGPIKKRKAKFGEANLRQTIAYADRGIEGISIASLDLRGLCNAKKILDEQLEHQPKDPYSYMKKPGAFQ